MPAEIHAAFRSSSDLAAVLPRVLQERYAGRNDGTAICTLDVPGNAPVGAFWSVIVYTADRHLQKNPYDAYWLNSVTAKKKPQRFSHSAIRRLRWQASQLSANHVRLEPHGAAISPAPNFSMANATFRRRKQYVDGSVSGRGRTHRCVGNQVISGSKGPPVNE